MFSTFLFKVENYKILFADFDLINQSRKTLPFFAILFILNFCQKRHYLIGKMDKFTYIIDITFFLGPVRERTSISQ